MLGLHACKGCCRLGWGMKIARAYETGRGGKKWICRNRKACISRQMRQNRKMVT